MPHVEILSPGLMLSQKNNGSPHSQLVVLAEHQSAGINCGLHMITNIYVLLEKKRKEAVGVK